MLGIDGESVVHLSASPDIIALMLCTHKCLGSALDGKIRPKLYKVELWFAVEETVCEAWWAFITSSRQVIELSVKNRKASRRMQRLRPLIDRVR